MTTEGVVCSSCATANEPGARFCEACGSALELACPACGQAPSRGHRAANSKPDAGRRLT